MTDRLKGLVVMFDGDIREDDAESIINAIRMVKYVKAVEPLMANPGDWVTAEKTRKEIEDRVLAVLRMPSHTP